MERVFEGLYASVSQPLPFAQSILMRAFLCQRERGNLLLYTVGALDTEAQAIEELGGVARQYLNHRHEAEFVSQPVGSRLFVHENERAAVVEKARVDETFRARHTVDDDFDVIPAPGHTPGATAYRWTHDGRRVLFTGDTIYLSNEEWVAAVLGSSDRDAYIASLELIRELDFDVLVPWIATGGRSYYAMTDRSDARRRIDSILARVTQGHDR
jgi:glyoxylase-like metal-dependent hydrolase (beta-lactamase superfamily II)